MENGKLREQINVVVDAREKATEAKDERVASYNKWLDENLPLFKEETEAKLVCSTAEVLLKEMALQAYAITREKAVAPGIGIREVTVLTYDNKVAFDWAKAHKLALKLDTEAFKKIAKADPPDFVKITKEPTATIAQELSKIA